MTPNLTAGVATAPVRVVRRRAVTCALALLLAIPQTAAARPEKVDQPRLAFVHDNTIFESTTAGRVREVTRRPQRAPDKYSPTWSPDGERLAYTSPSCGRLGGCDVPGSYLVGFDIHVVDVRTGRTELLLFEPHMAIWDVTWSPDGSQLAFTGYSVNETGLLLLGAWHLNVYVVDVASGRVTPVTADGVSRSPVWSPDSSRLAYISAREGGSSHVYVARPTVTGVPTRVSHAHGGIWTAEWSPNGRWIAYTAHEPFTEELLSEEEPEIWLARPDGSGSKPTGEAGHWIDWAPNSRRLVLARTVRDGSASQVYVLRLGGTARYVTDGESPRWAPDGRHLALLRSSRTSPHNTLVILDLVDRDEAHPFWTGDGLSAYHRWAP